MVSFTPILVSLVVASVGVFSAPAASYIWSFWTDGKAKITQKNGKDGIYSVKWEVLYSGTFAPIGNGYLSLYGWTTNPLVEYYIVDAIGTHNPADNPDAKMKGNVTSDGGFYNIMTKKRVNKPSIQGTATFDQFWSIRTDNRVGGKITTGNHFKAWEAAGLKLGRQDYMIVAARGAG